MPRGRDFRCGCWFSMHCVSGVNDEDRDEDGDENRRNKQRE